MRRLIAEEDRLDEYILASAGLSIETAGAPAEAGAQWAARAQGIDLRSKRARMIEAGDFRRFDLILAMDASSRDALRARAPAGTQHKVHLLLDFSTWIGESEIPDPSGGSGDGYANVLDLLQLAVRGLMESLDQAVGELAVPEFARARLKVSSAT